MRCHFDGRRTHASDGLRDDTRSTDARSASDDEVIEHTRFWETCMSSNVSRIAVQNSCVSELRGCRSRRIWQESRGRHVCCEIVHLPPPSGRNASEHEDGHERQEAAGSKLAPGFSLR